MKNRESFKFKLRVCPILIGIRSRDTRKRALSSETIFVVVVVVVLHQLVVNVRALVAQKENADET